MLRIFRIFNNRRATQEQENHLHGLRVHIAEYINEMNIEIRFYREAMVLDGDRDEHETVLTVLRECAIDTNCAWIVVCNDGYCDREVARRARVAARMFRRMDRVANVYRDTAILDWVLNG